MTDDFGSKLFAVFLVDAVDLGQIVIARLHGPDGIALVTESLRGVFSDARVNKQGLIVDIDDERADVVVIMALIVMAALHRHI